MEHAPLPWSACRKGDCQCKQLWCDDYPIAKITCGKWGDDFPTVEVTGVLGSIEGKLTIEAVMGQIEYGEISDELATANIKFIVQACNNHYILIEGYKKLVEAVKEDKRIGDKYDGWDDAIHEAEGAIADAEKGTNDD